VDGRKMVSLVQAEPFSWEYQSECVSLEEEEEEEEERERGEKNQRRCWKRLGETRFIECDTWRAPVWLLNMLLKVKFCTKRTGIMYMYVKGTSCQNHTTYMLTGICMYICTYIHITFPYKEQTTFNNMFLC
jgi:hypothetical protein